jgi:ribosomal protein S12 methylthiotransferase accessory factor YcaO
LLCLEAEPSPPTFVAWSCDPGGFGFVFGAACRFSQDDAIPAALRELRQMEFSLDLSARRSAGGHSPSLGEQARLARATRLDTRNDARFQTHARSTNSSRDALDEATFTPQNTNTPDIRAEVLTPPDAPIHVCRATSNSTRTAISSDDPYCAF